MGDTSNAESTLRLDVENALKLSDRDHAIQAIRTLLAEHPSTRNYRYLASQTRSEEFAKLGFKPFRIALLSSFSSEFCHDAIIAHGMTEGLCIEIYQAPFNNYQQEILNPDSGLYQAKPKLTILAVEGSSWIPEIYDWKGLQDSSTLIQSFKEGAENLVATFRKHTSAPLLIHSLADPEEFTLGIADNISPNGQQLSIGFLNTALRTIASAHADVYLLDYNHLIAQFGRSQWYDDRMRLYAKLPLSSLAISELAKHYLRYFRNLSGMTRKCLVLDLDNTLWGGILGEDGISGIALGSNYPGNAFVEFQRCVGRLRSKGVLLAIASKNNRSDVEQAFAQHDSMVLKMTDFAATEIHWEPKSESLKRIAQSLNIGLDHMVFVDDNPAECAEVRRSVKQVTIVQLPPRPESAVATLLNPGWFDTLSISKEDLERSALYQQRAQAEALRSFSGGLDSFYRDLKMTIRLSTVNASSISRAAQLTQKTNQFNVTTKRYTTAELSDRMSDPDWLLLTSSVIDRFGDNGIVGLLMAHRVGSAFVVDTFLLSCRVIGRTVETAMLGYLVEVASNLKGVSTILGDIVPTAKNAPARDLYDRHGFAKEEGDVDGATHWRLDLNDKTISIPDWFVVERPIKSHG